MINDNHSDSVGFVIDSSWAGSHQTLNLLRLHLYYHYFFCSLQFPKTQSDAFNLFLCPANGQETQYLSFIITNDKE